MCTARSARKGQEKINCYSKKHQGRAEKYIYSAEGAKSKSKLNYPKSL